MKHLVAIFVFAFSACVSTAFSVEVSSGAVTENDQYFKGRKAFDANVPNVQTLSGNLTLTKASKLVQILDANGSHRDVTLGDVESCKGLTFYFKNSSGTAVNLVIKNAGGTTIVTVGQDQSGHAWSDGVTWYGDVFSTVSAGMLPAAGTTAGATSQTQTFNYGVTLDTIVGATAAPLTVTGKVGATNTVGNAVTVTGGAGNGTGAGANVNAVGGASGAGATGNGGSVTLTGGAAASTNGAGGSVVLTPGVKAGTGIDGGIMLRSAGGYVFKQQTAASAEADGAQSITAAQMINGIVVHTVTGASALSTPTGAAISAGCPASLAVGDSFELTVISIGTGSDDISTLTAGDGNVTFVGNVAVPIDATTYDGSATWIFRNTGTDTWVGYRKN